jgi:crotonobetainyl-CoA:carnitine CoA-transferase CaiB-like acyl-CoA transferase
MLPLEGITVLDFSTLLPGPLAGLILARAGARIIKVERPGAGDEMRSYQPRIGDHSINFAMLNAGKESLAIDLKSPEGLAQLRPYLESADVILEQFRPGVMDRLGIGYEAISRINPSAIYCTITGWGQDGPEALKAGHDLNYLAEAGILGLSADATGAPILPPVLVADIAGGAYPAVMNILLALRQRDRTGKGAFLDIPMAENLLSFAYWGLGNGFGAQRWPVAGEELVTGGTPRYQIYRTSDDRFLAAAPLEDKFWHNFCEAIGLPSQYRDEGCNAKEATRAVAELISRNTAAHWMQIFDGLDVCCSIVATLEEAVRHPQFLARNTFGRTVSVGEATMPALPLPVVAALSSNGLTSPPALGEGVRVQEKGAVDG